MKRLITATVAVAAFLGSSAHAQSAHDAVIAQLEASCQPQLAQAVERQIADSQLQVTMKLAARPQTPAEATRTVRIMLGPIETWSPAQLAQQRTEVASRQDAVIGRDNAHLVGAPQRYQLCMISARQRAPAPAAAAPPPVPAPRPAAPVASAAPPPQQQRSSSPGALRSGPGSTELEQAFGGGFGALFGGMGALAGPPASSGELLEPLPESKTPVTECLSLVGPPDKPVFKNSCPFQIVFAFCNLAAKPGSLSDAFNCRNSKGGTETIGASTTKGGLFGGGTEFFACRRPQLPAAHYELGRGMMGSCF